MRRAAAFVLISLATTLGCGEDSASENDGTSGAADGGDESRGGSAAGTGGSRPSGGQPASGREASGGTPDDGGAAGSAGTPDGGDPAAISGGSAGAAAGAPDDGGAPGIPILETCVDYAAEHCAGFEECAPALFVRELEDGERCVELVSEVCSRDALGGWGIADLAGCTALLADADCDGVLAAPTDACALGIGPKEADEPCTKNAECESGFCRFSGSPCGACGRTLLAGDQCIDVEDGACQTNTLVCNRTTNRCVEPAVVELGESCNLDSRLCRPGLVCSMEQCAPALDVGGECLLDHALCDVRKGLACNGTTHVCEPNVEIRALDESCGTDPDGIFPRCSDLAYCDPETKICVPRAESGEPCRDDDPVFGHSCTLENTCEDGTCVSTFEGCVP